MAKTVFTDGDPVTRDPGTIVLAAFLNLIFKHRHDGIDQDGSAPIDYAVDSGSANALVVALDPPLTAHVPGLLIRVKVANANTGAVTVNVNGLGAVPVKKNVSDALTSGDIAAGQIIPIVYDGTNYQLLSGLTKALADTLYATAAQGAKADAALPVSGVVISDHELSALSLSSFPTEFTSWDISSSIPEGYRYAVIYVECYLNGPDSNVKPRIRFRPSGSSGEGQVVCSPWAAGSGDKVGNGNQFWIPLGTNRKVEYKFESPPTATADVAFRLQGYVR